MHYILGIYSFMKMILLLLLFLPVPLQIVARKGLCPCFALVSDVIYSHSYHNPILVKCCCSYKHRY